MFYEATIVANIKTDLTNFSWTAPSASQSTKYQGIYTDANWENADGSPFLCILTPSAIGQNSMNVATDFKTKIELHICSKWPQVTGANDIAQREEAMKNVREAWDALKVYMVKLTTLSTWFGGSYKGYNMNFSYADNHIDQLNLKRRVVTMEAIEVITRL